MSTVAQRLKEFRAAVGLTQREVASLCGLGKRTIIYWEMGEREIRCTKLVPLSKEYDLDFNWLILGKGSMFHDASEPAVVELPELDETMQASPGHEAEYPPAELDEDLSLLQRLRRK